MSMRRKTEEKIFSYLEQYHMICPHDHIVLGVSGGADSVCLLIVLWEYAKRTPLTLSVVHVNHGIRPDAARDAGYVEALCGKYEIPFYLIKTDVREFAEREKCSEEDAGRRIRYEAFRRIAKETGANKIAVAHNCNDRAETMLFHLFRGSGLKGLCGIRPLRQEIIRPLLCLERTEIEEYLTERQINWCKDSTNDTDEYARNRIRHHILPYVERELVPGCVGRMTNTAELLTETEEYMGQQTRAARERCVKETEEKVERKALSTIDYEPAKADMEYKYEISVERFREFHPALQKRLIHLLAEELSPTGKDISAVHIREVMSLFEERGNRKVDLPMGIYAARSYGTVFLGKNREYVRKPLGIYADKRRIMEEEVLHADLGEEGMLELKVLSGDQYEEVPRNEYTKWFDYDKIEKPICIRYRETGDFLSIADGNGQLIHKSLKKYMITEKIPREERDKIPLLTDGCHVLWIIGGRISEYYKIDGNTKHILQVQLRKSRSGGKTEDENE